MMFFKRVTAVIVTLFVLFSQSLCLSASAEEINYDNGIVILHTNDVHCGMNSDDDTFGYAELAGYISKLETDGYEVILVDAGDAVQGDIVGYMSDGKYIVDVMNEVGYDVAIPGNHEYDYGMERFFELSDLANFDYLSSNFVNLETNSNVFDGYKIIEKNGVKIGFVGITTPKAVTSSTPKYFMNEQGEYIYGFCAGDDGQELYDKVQATVDEALADGAEYIIAIGHLGIENECKPWTSEDVIANVSGIDVFIDGHSHSVIESEFVLDKDNNEVILNSCGTKLQYIGEITISDDEISAKLIGNHDYIVSDDETSQENIRYKELLDFMQEIEESYLDDVNQIVAKSECDLIINDTETGERLIRNTQTNMGDFCSDAYRYVLESDIALVNGGGIRADIQKGDITFGTVISVNPFGNQICVVEATGQQILDALELGAMNYPEENGGFLHVSGITYEIHSYFPHSIVFDENMSFVKVDGEYRVKNVMFGDKPLELDKIYTVAASDYIIKNGGGGSTMFKDCKIIKDDVMVDNELLLKYVEENLNGIIDDRYANPYGEGRVVGVKEMYEEITPPENTPDEKPETEQQPEQTPPADTGADGLKTITVILSLAVVLAIIKYRK